MKDTVQTSSRLKRRLAWLFLPWTLLFRLQQTILARMKALTDGEKFRLIGWMFLGGLALITAWFVVPTMWRRRKDERLGGFYWVILGVTCFVLFYQLVALGFVLYMIYA